MNALTAVRAIMTVARDTGEVIATESSKAPLDRPIDHDIFLAHRTNSNLL